MSAIMQQSASQQNFYGRSYYMSASSTLAELFSQVIMMMEKGMRELQLQDRMLNPIAFSAEMMGHITYCHQAPDSQMQAPLYKLM